MHSRIKTVVLLISVFTVSGTAWAQLDFSVRGRPVQIHSFASQGFAYSSQNNYLTMQTSRGSLAMTDVGLNASVQITDRFHVGAQLYDRNIGNLGNWDPSLDWAFGDYKFTPWLGVRAGKVKTTLGLYNDTQDFEFLHTWAILPQSSYPMDLRASRIAHTGADLYGQVSLRRYGDLSYTGYVGSRSADEYGGYRYGLQDFGIDLTSESGWQAGGDLRWTNPVNGLVLGVSYLHSPAVGDGRIEVAPQVRLPFHTDSGDNTTVFYGEYRVGNLTLAGEYRREILKGTESVATLPPLPYELDQRGWFASASYRICRKLELGTYHSRFYPAWDQDHAAPDGHIFEQAVTARIDLNRHWDVKIEGHFMDGYGYSYSLRGFYPRDNPGGLKPTTNLLVLRTGWNF